MHELRTSKDCPNRLQASAEVQRMVMFAIALTFLLLTAFSLHHVDQTRVDADRGRLLGGLFIALWAPIFAESVIGYWRCGDYSWKAGGRLLLIWLVPPYRMILATYPQSGCVWLPVIGWQPKDRALFERLDRGFSVPMLLIALLILPILAIELCAAKYIPEYPTLGLLLDFGTSVIWLAFAFEFILMSAIAEAKLAFIAKNWINLAIVILPMIAFLRGFQAVRLLRLGKAAKALRVYRLRGLGLRAWRGVVALELVEALLYRQPEARLEHLKFKLQDKEHDVELLRRRIARLKADIRARQFEQDSEIID
jgi:voltage-gated potassium channel